MKTIKDKLTCLLYILTRDELPIGTIIGILRHHVELCNDPEFSNKHLESWAREEIEKIFKNEILDGHTKCDICEEQKPSNYVRQQHLALCDENEKFTFKNANICYNCFTEEVKEFLSWMSNVTQTNQFGNHMNNCLK